MKSLEKIQIQKTSTLGGRFTVLVQSPAAHFFNYFDFFHGHLQANASPLLISFEAMSGDTQIGELSEYLKSNSCPFLQ